jgi:pimeloyl-ACP methyl ester carboxylesterase
MPAHADPRLVVGDLGAHLFGPAHQCARLGENAKRIKCPVLFIRGDQEPKENYPAERFKENSAGPCQIAIVADCDHFYVGAEERVVKIVTDWLERTLGYPRLWF